MRGTRVGVVVALVVLAGMVAWRVEEARKAPVDATHEDASPAGTAAPEPAPTAAVPLSPSSETVGGDEMLRDAPESAWAKVDFKALKATIPNNLYWIMAMPTKDEALIEWRRQERDRWNVEYGKVLSGNGTEEEVTAYYAYRQRLSNDYVEFAGYVLAHYGDVLPAQDKQLLNLAMDMHMTRLQEIPRQLAEAQERRKQHDEAREAWRAEQEQFAGKANP
jgi:hypothetical protein